jgi:hypothetical protein
MRSLVAAVSLLVAVCVLCPARAGLVEYDPAEESTTEIGGLVEELHRAKLGQIALLIEQRSEGKSRLLIGLGARAEPKVPVFMRSPATQKPFVAVYPVSYPVTAELARVGKCELLGAVSLGVDATAPRIPGEGGELRVDVAMAAITSGVYLLAYAMDAPEPHQLALVTVTVDDEGRTTFMQRGGGYIPVQRFESHRGGDRPGASVKFPPKGKAAEDDPPWRAHARMVWRDVGYEFALDLMPVLNERWRGNGQ